MSEASLCFYYHSLQLFVPCTRGCVWSLGLNSNNTGKENRQLLNNLPSRASFTAGVSEKGKSVLAGSHFCRPFQFQWKKKGLFWDTKCNWLQLVWKQLQSTVQAHVFQTCAECILGSKTPSRFPHSSEIPRWTFMSVSQSDVYKVGNYRRVQHLLTAFDRKAHTPGTEKKKSDSSHKKKTL